MCSVRTFLTKALRTAWATSFSVFKWVNAYSVSESAAATADAGKQKAQIGRCRIQGQAAQGKHRRAPRGQRCCWEGPRTVEHVRRHVANLDHRGGRHRGTQRMWLCEEKAQRQRRERQLLDRYTAREDTAGLRSVHACRHVSYMYYSTALTLRATVTPYCDR